MRSVTVFFIYYRNLDKVRSSEQIGLKGLLLSLVLNHLSVLSFRNALSGLCLVNWQPLQDIDNAGRQKVSGKGLLHTSYSCRTVNFSADEK